MKKSKSAQLLESAQSEYLKIVIRSRIGRYLCRDHKFRNDIKKARGYRSVRSCITAIAQMKPEVRQDLLNRGAHIEMTVISQIMLPPSAFSSVSKSK
jgi:hypothetical protein